ncbi:MAG: DMT family transporter [Eubacteriaceae bacterium]|nr:DMT family transporter [Eubacteriaceae bacterium]
MNNKTIIFLSAAAMCVISGIQFSVMHSALSSISPLGFLWLRFLFAFLSAFLFAGIRNIRLLTDKTVLILSVIHPVSAFYFQSLAASQAEVYVTSVITALSPAVISLMAFISGREKLTVRMWFYITLIVSGGVICAGSPGNFGKFFSPAGLYILLSVILRGLYYVRAGQMTKSISPASLSFSQITYAFIIYSVLFLLSGEKLPPLTDFAPLDILKIAYMGVFATTAAYFINNFLLKSISLSANGAITALTFVVSLLSAAFLSGEEIRMSVIIGSAVVIVGITLLMREKSKSFK